MTVPLDTVDDMRSMEAAGRSRFKIARALYVSRIPVTKRADMEDMSPTAPLLRGGADPHSRAARNGGVPIVLSTRK